MADSPKAGKLLRSSVSLSVNMVNLYDRIEKKSYLKNQLARAATAIGANIHEASYAESGEDFIHKLRIALKECHETEYWLTVLNECIPQLTEETHILRKDAGAIRNMLISSINTRLISLGKAKWNNQN